MSALFQSVEHVFAVAASDTVKTAKFVKSSVLPALQKVQADQKTVEAVTALVSPQAANMERVGFALLGVVVTALESASNAAEGQGLNLTLDAELVKDVKALVPAVKDAVAKLAA